MEVAFQNVDEEKSAVKDLKNPSKRSPRNFWSLMHKFPAPHMGRAKASRPTCQLSEEEETPWTRDAVECAPPSRLEFFPTSKNKRRT